MCLESLQRDIDRFCARLPPTGRIRRREDGTLSPQSWSTDVSSWPTSSQDLESILPSNRIGHKYVAQSRKAGLWAWISAWPSFVTMLAFLLRLVNKCTFVWGVFLSWLFPRQGSLKARRTSQLSVACRGEDRPVTAVVERFQHASIAVVGDRGVGKSAIIDCLLGRPFTFQASITSDLTYSIATKTGQYMPHAEPETHTRPGYPYNLTEFPETSKPQTFDDYDVVVLVVKDFRKHIISYLQELPTKAKVILIKTLYNSEKECHPEQLFYIETLPVYTESGKATATLDVHYPVEDVEIWTLVTNLECKYLEVSPKSGEGVPKLRRVVRGITCKILQAEEQTAVDPVMSCLSSCL